MHKLPVLSPGDSVEIIAPASRCSDQLLNQLKELLISWQLNCIISDEIFGEDLLCSNKDPVRLKLLTNALQNKKTKAVICARGGYGSMRLIPDFCHIKPPLQAKLFVGMSDITALNLFLQQQWGWPIVHAALALDKFTNESIIALKALLFAEVKQIEFVGVPLNKAAEENCMIETIITGGNLTLLQTSIGTRWQMDAKQKMILLEEIGERGYRVDRMLEHLRQSGIFNQAAAILLGDFIGGEEPNGESLIQPVLERFAKNRDIPVIQVKGVGHGPTNFPLPLGTNTQVKLGNRIEIICSRH